MNASILRKKCGIIAAVCYKEKQRISRDKTHETDHTTQEDKNHGKDLCISGRRM